MKRFSVLMLALGGIPLLIIAVVFARQLYLVYLMERLSALEDAEFALEAAPEPARVGEVRFELRLPHEFLPDDHWGKRVEWVAYPLPDAAPRLQGNAVEDEEEAHLFRFDASFDRGGPWRVETAAFWSDGREFARKEFNLQVAP